MIVSFVLPVFNCEGNITPLFHEFQSIAAKYPMFQPEYIFVDDASTDESLKEIESLDSPYIKLLGLKENIGSCIAALRGLGHVSGARVVVMAADGGMLRVHTTLLDFWRRRLVCGLQEKPADFSPKSFTD